jgi:arylsulfatase
MSKRNKYIFIIAQIFGILSLTGFGLGALQAEDSKAKPNIIIILADDMGYSDLGCYGSEIETPNLDGLAKNGLRFTQFYNTARCWPSRGALMTGYYAQQIRRDMLPNETGGYYGERQQWAPLLSEFLKPAGYRNYHSGKWHIDGKVLENGFDRSFCLEKNFGYFSSIGNLVDDRPDPVTNANYYSTLATSSHVLECLKDHAVRYKDRPFFHFVAFTAPHFPLQALPEDIAKYRDRYLEGWDVMRNARYAREKEMGIVNTSLSPVEREVGPPYYFKEVLGVIGPDEVNRPLPWTELTEDQRRFQATKMAIHAAMVDRMDREIGRIIAQLKEMGAFENTMILFVSDNGASAEMMVRHGGHDPKAEPGSANTYLCLGPGFSSACNTPLRRHKSWVYEGGISTPLVVHWPKGIAARNELRHTPGHLIDIVPTVLEAAGIKKPTTWNGEPIPPAPGKSLVPAFVKDQQIDRESLWWLHEGNRALRAGDWKIVADKGKPWELYDLSVDRAEQHDLAASKPDRVQKLERLWLQQTDRFTEQAALPKAKQPNILFLFSDDHALQAISAYGGRFKDIAPTPNLDRIAKAGAIFERSYCANSICGPSRACILTGKHSIKNGFIDNSSCFNGEQPTFPKYLQKAGYQTAIIGKWHLVSNPTGFDYWEVLPSQGSYWNPDFIQMDGKQKRFEGYVTDLIADKTLDWLKNRRDKDKPFLLMSQHKAPHRNWFPPARHFDLFKGRDLPEPETLFDDYANRSVALKKQKMSINKDFFWGWDMLLHGKPADPRFADGLANNEYTRMNVGQKAAFDKAYGEENNLLVERLAKGMSDEEVIRWKYQRYIKDYLRCIRSLDENIGRVLDYLAESGLAENTIVIYSSDQGFYLGEHGWYDKRWMFEESFAMPFLIRWPGVINPGVRSQALIQNIDYAPTFLEAAGIKIPEDIQGRSLLPVFKNNGVAPADWRASLYYYYTGEDTHNVAKHDGVATQRYKLMRFPDTDEWQLFDREKDPQEMRSLHDDPAYAETLAKMKALYKELRATYEVDK